MPRPKRSDAPEPKRRSRHGCWPCKRRKIKCGEEKPACSNCMRQGDACDYSIRLNWEGRTKRKAIEPPTPGSTSDMAMFSTIFSQSPSIASPSPSERQVSTSIPGFVQSEWAVSPHASSPGNPRALRITPVSPSSALANSPTGCDSQSQSTTYDAVPIESPAASTVLERAMSPPEYPASMTANDGLHRSPVFQSSDHNSVLGSRFNYLPSLGFESNSISQPTSFLRETFSAADISAQSLSNQDVPRRAKRYKDKDDILQSHQRSPDVNSVGGLSTTRLVPLPLNHSLRRVSVDSLLSQSAETNLSFRNTHNMMTSQAIVTGHEVFFGYDCGTPDYDLHKNNDLGAIEPVTPSEEVFANDELSPVSEQTPTGSVHVRRRSSFTTGGGYYVTPVRVKIPRRMTPLPSTLLENPINMMYFHHFIDHTARILVPHDCDENAFLSVLPAMAIADPNLLNLMLAYSASHRARFLRHAEPSNRIAHWVRDVFPTLRHALNEPDEKVTYSHLATAIMLLSLKIVSPSTFEVPITWQMHLKLARDLFVACGVHHQPQPDNKVAYFLAHWFGYLDLIGSLSCRRSEAPLLQTNYWSPTISGPLPGHDGDEGDDENYRVDCFAGFTALTGAYLARLGHLTHLCDNERFDECDNFLPHWTPSQETIHSAQALLDDMERSRLHGHAMGTHHTELENDEMIAIDQAFHWSAVLHLYRRVLGKDPYCAEVQEAVDHLCNAIARIRPGSSTECSVLFPLFTAGCEVRDPEQRLEIMTRVMNFEAEGLKQFKNARKLMQRCWDKDLPWIALAHGEFLG